MQQKPSILRHARHLLMFLPLALLSGCNMVVMNPTGDIALQERDLILLSLAVMLIVVIPTMVMTVVFALRYRKGKSPHLYDPHFHHSTKIEMGIWLVPMAIILCLGVVTWITTHTLDPFRPIERIAADKPLPANTPHLDIQVVAMDWKWLFIYPEQGIATVNELALPVDVPVRFSITSTSQMNTFYAPTLAGMIYAMPGMQSQLHAVLNHPGDTWGFSGNYTGDGFSDMRFRLHGTDQAGFDQWVAKVKASAGTLTTENYLALEKPSNKTPVTYFSAAPQDLYGRILNRCVTPGTACLYELMAKDRAADRDNGGIMNMPAMDHSKGEHQSNSMMDHHQMAHPAQSGT